MLKTKNLGTQGLATSTIGLGCMGMSQWYGPSDEAEAESTLLEAVNAGVTLFDTAEAYGPHVNEALVGRVLKPHRHNVTIATKFGFVQKDGKMVGADSRPEFIRTSVEGSLTRLQSDYIDLLYQHRFDPNVPIEDVVGTMAQLVNEGKVRYIGLCEVSASTISKAHAVHPLTAVQSEYSVWERGVEKDIFPTLQRLNIGFVGFCPLGRGFLAGNTALADSYAPNDFRHHDPRFAGDNGSRNKRLVAVLEKIAQAYSLTAAQVALGWVVRAGDQIVPIPGTKRRSYLRQNIAAAEADIPSAAFEELDKFIAEFEVAGPRYNETMMKYIDK